MPRCENCKHPENAHIEKAWLDPQTGESGHGHPCHVQGCRCHDYKPELVK